MHTCHQVGQPQTLAKGIALILTEIFILYDAHDDIKATLFYVVGVGIKSSFFFALPLSL